ILFVSSALAGSVIVGTAAIGPGPTNNEFTNLKVLPRNISSKELNRIMVDEFNDGLGVSCTFCHAENKDSQKPDYASDANKEKERARGMMRMTLGINKKYLKVKHPAIGDQSMVVSCATCHKGRAFPE